MPRDKSCFAGIVAPLILVIFLTATSSVMSNDVSPADMVLINGRIITVDEYMPEAQALAIRGDRIAAAGSNEEIKLYIDKNTEIIDLQGKLAVPGLIDGHAHFLSLGYAQMRLDLKTAKSWDEIVAMVESEVGKVQPGDWIIGRGWHQDKWTEIPDPNVDGLPLHHNLSRVSPENPVLLTHASGHSCIANAEAMRLAGITSQTPDPEGGRIIRDDRGSPIGIFLETAVDSVFAIRDSLLDARTPEEIEKDKIRAIDLATTECLSEGLTGFHDAGSSFASINLFRKLAEEDRLDLRLWVMISENNDSLRQRIDDYRIIGAGHNRLTVRTIKRLIDGALGSHGAWLLEPYSDLPNSTGLNTEPVEDIRETARIALEHGFQMCTHAIGDRGNCEILNIYEEAMRSVTESTDLRWRIEHAQHLHPDDIPRFGQLGVVASMQTCHCTSDGPWVPKRLGDNRSEEGAYVWRKLMDAGAIISNGTDAPVEDVDPLANFFAAVTRQLPDGSRFYPDQRMSREEALRACTINPAFAAFEEDIKGSLTPGKLADITVLSHDIMTIPEEDILNTYVVYTIVGGEIMYRHEGR